MPRSTRLRLKRGAAASQFVSLYRYRICFIFSQFVAFAPESRTAHSRAVVKAGLSMSLVNDKADDGNQRKRVMQQRVKALQRHRNENEAHSNDLAPGALPRSPIFSQGPKSRKLSVSEVDLGVGEDERWTPRPRPIRLTDPASPFLL